jgi:hypothetical protein
MNEIKRRKQEVIEKMKPVWDEEYRRGRELDRKVWQEKKNQIKCWWTYPWGHILTEFKWNDFGHFYRDCMVCNKRSSR